LTQSRLSRLDFVHPSIRLRVRLFDRQLQRFRFPIFGFGYNEYKANKVSEVIRSLATGKPPDLVRIIGHTAVDLLIACFYARFSIQALEPKRAVSKIAGSVCSRASAKQP